MEPMIRSTPEETFETEWLGSDTLRIRLPEELDPNQIIPELLVFFERQFHSGVVQILFDMGTVPFPNASFIAMLVTATMEARRRGGDFKIFNLSETARSYLATFSPLTYLSIAEGEDVLKEDGVDPLFQTVAEELDFEAGKPVSFTIPARVDALQFVTDGVTRLAQKIHMDPTEVSKLKVAVYEACMNVIEHGYRFLPGEEIGIEIALESDSLRVTIIDHAEPFDFSRIKSYNIMEAFEKGQRGGYGTYIICHAVDEVSYEPDKEGNRLTLIKRIVPAFSEDLNMGD